MKRVFAFLSAFAFALALFGTSIQAADVEPAPGKFVVDPTLTGDEIPLYIMNSIYTTFPNYYDNVAKPDTKYQTGRLYPWNETKLLVPQFVNGETTGKSYSIYFTGGLSYITSTGAPISQAGNNQNVLAMKAPVHSTGFESTDTAAFGVTTVYNNVAPATQGTGTYTWDMIYGTVSTTAPIVGLQSAQMRWYTSAPTVKGSLVSNFAIANVTDIYFKAAQLNGLKVKVTHSINGVDFVGAQVFEPGTTATEFKYHVTSKGNVQVKFEVELPETLPTATSRLYIDDVKFIEAVSIAQPAPVSASLSFLRYNNTGYNVKFDVTQEPGNNAHIAYMVFDGNGKAVRGLAPASSITNMYCYAAAPATGVIKADENFTGCAMLLDAENNPTGPNYFQGRIQWDSQINPTDNPELFNANGYLGAGWNAHKWDAYDAEAGVAYAFIAGGDANYGQMTTADVAFHNAQTENADNQLAANTRRDVFRYMNFPVNGIFYSFAYLDRGVMMPQFLDMYWSGMKHGRDADYNAMFKTYDFSVQAVVPVNSGALIPMESITPVTIEVLAGSSFVPRNNVNFDAMGKYWGTPDLYTGFINNLAVLEHTLIVNGSTVAMPSKWTTKAEMVAEFFADWNAWACANRAAEYCVGGTIGPITAANAYAQRYSMISETAGGNMWWGIDKAAPTKWMFLISFVSNVRASQVPALSIAAFNTTTLAASGTSTSSGTVMNELLAYFAEEHRTAWPATSNYTVGYGTLPGAMAQSAQTYSIDTTGKAPGYAYNVDFKTKNTATSKESTLRIKYVVTQVYTPRITVNQLALLKSQGDAFDIRSIATATDGFGNDISQDIKFISEKELNVKSLAAGTYPITITVKDVQYGIKEVTKVVFLKVADLTAPQVTTKNLVLPFGALFNIRDGFVSAYDNLDGNLLGSQDYNPFVEMSDPIPANRAGLYVVEYEVYDRTGNSTMGVFTVRVLADYHTQIMDKLNTLNTTAAANTIKAELITALNALKDANAADLAAVKAHLETLLGDLGDDVDTSVSGVKTYLETLINSALADLEVSVIESVEAIPAQDNTATVVAGSVSTVSSLGVGAGVIILLLKRH